MRKHPESTNIGKEILAEWADISGINKKDLLSNDPIAKATQLQTLRDIVNIYNLSKQKKQILIPI